MGLEQCRRRESWAVQMEMWRGLAGVLPPRMAAEVDRLSIRVAAIRITAIARFEIEERKMAGHEFDTAQFWRLGSFEHRHSRNKFRSVPLARLMQARRFSPTPPGPTPRQFFGRAKAGKPHALGATERRVPGIKRLEPRVERLGDCRKRHAAGKIFAQ